jgi:hypothetical protein
MAEEKKKTVEIASFGGRERQRQDWSTVNLTIALPVQGHFMVEVYLSSAEAKVRLLSLMEGVEGIFHSYLARILLGIKQQL